MKLLVTVIQDTINKELKSSLMYCLQAVNPSIWFYRFEQHYTKQQLRDALFIELTIKKDESGTIIPNTNNINKLKVYADAVDKTTKLLSELTRGDGFIITKDFGVCDDCKTATTEQIEIVKLKYTEKFRLYDGDMILYYEGYGVDNSSFNPLDDFGTGNAGCTELRYFKNGKFVTI